MRATPLFLAALFFLLAATACSPDVYRTRVQSSVAPDGFTPADFIILPGQDDIDSSGHDFYRHSKALAEALERRGFTRVRSAGENQVTIYLRFGILGEEVPHQGARLEHLFMLEILAVDAASQAHGQGTRTLWKVAATAHGHLDHRNKVFKVLMAACEPYLGQDADLDVRVHRQPGTGAYEFFPR